MRFKFLPLQRYTNFDGRSDQIYISAIHLLDVQLFMFFRHYKYQGMNAFKCFFVANETQTTVRYNHFIITVNLYF
jgi:hypothetical protein